MIISKTPFRISLFGGGTDYPGWFEKEGGAVLSTSIDKYCYITVRKLPPFFEQRHRFVWSKIELVDEYGEVAHPAIREGLRMLGMPEAEGLEIHHQGDLPARSGMGSSSSFAVGLIKAVTALRGEMISERMLALKAIDLEQNWLKENVGCQDQVAVAYGGMNKIVFEKGQVFKVHPVILPYERLKELDSKLMLFFTGTSRIASQIAGDLIANIGKNTENLRRMRAMVDEALSVLASNQDIDIIGHMLHETWMRKRELSKLISNNEVEALYDRARENGAIGGKLLGAGSSGFMLFYVPEEKQAGLVKALSTNLHVPFHFEDDGSTIVHYGSVY